MKESGAINIFYGVMAFIAVWAVASPMLEMRLTGTILDKFMNIGLLVLVILFQDQLKRFLVDLGSHKRWRFLRRLFSHKNEVIDNDTHQWIMAIVRACMSLSKSKTGALIVIQQDLPLENYENIEKSMVSDLQTNGRHFKYISPKLIDTNGRVYHMNYARFIPTEIKLNISGKDKSSPKLANLIEYFTLTKNKINE